jgi:MYXO-CTERM domain-containing protein
MVATAVGLVLLGMAAPRPVEACGGTFCDSGPQPMPVEQTGETILFVIDEGYIEAHIQIQYDPTTEAEQFAWVVPVTALPEFSVGSQPLFGNLLAATVPAYGLGNNNEFCGSDTGGFDEGCDGTGAADDGAYHLDLGGPGEPPAPEVVLATTVGAFEVFVLDGGTVDGVMQWLGDNGFQQDMAAAPILGEYLDEGHLFVAFRLTAQAEVGEIHPITLRYAGTEPCVPIRLTRIAAQDDMEIRALFLGDSRVSSSNYRHVTLNPLKLDWMGLGANYREVVTMAVDEPGADGHAFVTEYAGGSEVVGRDGLLDELWDPIPFTMAAGPEEAVSLLFDQNLYESFPADCQAQHPLIESLVARWLPTPPEITTELLCDDPSAFAAAVDPLAWDGMGFAADLEDRIIVPGQRANELLDTWPYLTRLYTTLSPNEMTADPMFHPTPDLPEQTTLTRTGTRNTFCDGDTSFSLPDGRLVALLDAFTWPDIAPEAMPWVETIEVLPAAGAPVIEVDHRDAIQMLLDEWNAEQGPPRSPTSPSCHDDTGTTTLGFDTDYDSAGAGDDTGGFGCGCRGAGTGGSGTALAMLGLLGLLRRRRG